MTKNPCKVNVAVAVSVLAGVAVLGFGAPQGAMGQMYIVTDLGTLGGEVSAAHAINNTGQVVGYSYTASGEYRAFLWEVVGTNGVMTDLGTLGGVGSVAHDINDAAQVVGWSRDADGYKRAFLYDSTNGMQELGTLPGGAYSVAKGINDGGQVVGWSATTNGLRAFLYDGGMMTDLNDLLTLPIGSNGVLTVAQDISSSGELVGTWYDVADVFGSPRAFHCSSGVGGTVAMDLGTLGGSWAGAHTLNDAGQVVGWSDTSESRHHGFVWEMIGTSGVMTDVGTLSGPRSEAYGINDAGQVVGYSNTAASEFEFRAFLYSGGAMLDLNNLISPASDWNLRVAYDINQAGHIVGWGEINGELHAFLLTAGPGRADGTRGTKEGSGHGAARAARDVFDVGEGLTSLEVVYVGDPGNDLDPATSNGAVAHTYYIGKYEVTVGQYTEFLNAVGAISTNGVYSRNMVHDLKMPPILRYGSPGSYRYTAVPGMENYPIYSVTWASCARFANWLHYGRPTGPQDDSTTEDGAYKFLGETLVENPENPRKPGARWVLPNLDEWYKAAFYDPDMDGAGGPEPGYWVYPTQSGTAPVEEPPPGGANSANYRPTPRFAIGPLERHTEVGAYAQSRSHYGTFDQAGNVWEFTETYCGGPRVMRGGSFWGLVMCTESNFFNPIQGVLGSDCEGGGGGEIAKDGMFICEGLAMPVAGFRVARVGCVADFDGDGDVDLADFAEFQVCFTGEGVGSACPCGDFDSDGDIDLVDFRAFSLALSGPG